MSESLLTNSMDRSIANQQPLLSSKSGPMTDDERRKYEEERSKLYQQMDDKDDEIQQQSQLAERVKQQLMEQEETIKQRKQEFDNLLADLQKAQDQNTKNKDETEDLFSAIQGKTAILRKNTCSISKRFAEIALNLEQKKTECTQLTSENEGLSVSWRTGIASALLLLLHFANLG